MSDKPQGYVFGRPTEYRPEFCSVVIELGAEGKSKVEIACELGVGRTTIKRWEEVHEDFRAAMAYAKDLEQAWWEKQGRINLAAQHFQSSMWSRSMAARFPDDWRETSRRENTGPDGGPQQVNLTGDAVAELTRRLARLSAISTEGGDAEGPQGQ